MSILEKFRNYFPINEIDSLYKYQEAVLKTLLNKNNTLAIIPTGGGKSLIFQLAALEQDGVTIVISPLLALMHEQVEYLKQKNIQAISLSSDLTFLEQREIYRNFNKLKPKLIYVSPERLQNYYFRSALIKSGLKVSMIVIDEAHCISQWGIDFRPEYSQIKYFIDYLKVNGQEPVVFALTATLSINPRKDIITEFQIKNPSIIVDSNVIRDNLNLQFIEVGKEDEKIDEIISFIKKQKCKKILIYLYSKEKCEELSKEFILKNYKTAYFHADLDFEQKSVVYNNFKKGTINVLFSTTAFGMGMNIPDIDSVIHYHLPGSIEEYYQHVGRGGRNKQLCPVANCLALWSQENFKVKKRRSRKCLITREILEQAIDLLNIRDNKDNLINIDYNNYKNAKINLTLVKYLFEKHKIIETIGEVHGTPKTIRFIKVKPFWEKILKNALIVDSFTSAAKKLNCNVQEIIDFIYKEDLSKNIEFLPALKRKIIIKANYNKIPEKILEKIEKEAQENLDYQLEQLDKLEKLFKMKDENKIKKFIAEALGVEYK